MSDEDNFSTTLAYVKSPKVSKRTMFQDELHMAVAARVAKQSAVEEKYFSDFDDYELMKDFSSTKKTARSGKAGKKKRTMNNFTFSDDDDEKPKKVSFVKNRRKDDAKGVGSLNTTEKPVADSHKNGNWNPPSFLKSTRSDRWGDEDSKGEERMPVPQPKERRMRRVPFTGEETKSSLLDEPPKPKPRPRLLKKQSNLVQDNELEKLDEKTYNSLSTSCSKLSSAINKHTLSKTKMHSRSPSPEYPRPTSYLSKASSLNISRTMSPVTDDRLVDSIEARVKYPTTDEDLTDTGVNSKSSEKKSLTLKELIQDTNDEVNTKKTERFSQEEANGQSSALKPNQCMVQCATNHAIRESLQENSLKPKEKDQAKMIWNGGKSQKAESSGKSISNRPLSSLTQTLDRSSIGKSPRPKTTEPRYLGTLKILDTKSSGNATSSLEAADTIRASIYQEWLEKKKQNLHEVQKKQKLKEQQENEKREQEKIESKKEAKASFQAWKAKKKDVLKETCSKKKEEEKKKQQAEAEKEEKKEIAKKAFEKWKEEKDMYLKEMLQNQKQIEKQKKKREKEQVTEKKKENAAAFIKWNEKKEVVLKQKMKENAKEEQQKKTEEQYMKYEKEEMALTMYEKWLEQKEKQEKREKKQRKIRSILHDEPPPPWSPPNKTIPFGK
ncbi:microtubule-associated protein 9 isoform X2 [Heptranchias perlo]|uniref:microtubule-associated protein 9 isoform X2 n=1 Tax=Heptranchias perlo TaxID=212740 RepID=UPI003559D255